MIKDTLQITALAIPATIGIHDWEQRIQQPLLFDITIPIDLRDCNDTLSNSIDYANLCQHIIALVGSRPFKLIETVAEVVAASIKETFEVTQLSIKVSKPHAVQQAGNISITIHR